MLPIADEDNGIVPMNYVRSLYSAERLISTKRCPRGSGLRHNCDLSLACTSRTSAPCRPWRSRQQLRPIEQTGTVAQKVFFARSISSHTINHCRGYWIDHFEWMREPHHHGCTTSSRLTNSHQFSGAQPFPPSISYHCNLPLNTSQRLS